MIVAIITDLANSNVYYLGEEECRVVYNGQLRHFKPLIKDFKPTQQRLDKEYGGMVRLSGEGQIAISPYCLGWPPPLKLSVSIKNVDSNGRLTSFFESTAYLSEVNEEFSSYNIYSKEYDVKLLDDAPDFPDTGTPEEIDRVYPLLIGTVSCIAPIRIGNDTTQAYYHKAGVTGTDPTRLTGDYSVFDTGFQRQKYSTDLGTIIDHTTYFESVLASDGSTLNPPLSEFRLTGTNSNITTLVGLFQWAVNRINTQLSTHYSLVYDNARNPSPNVNCYITEQQNLFDFLSEVSSFFTHLFYVDEDNSEIVLVDMFADNGTLSLSDSDGRMMRILSRKYNFQEPVKKLYSEWVNIEPGYDADGYPLFIESKSTQQVDTSNLNGREYSIVPYTDLPGEISVALINIGKLVQAPRISIEISSSTSNIVPGIGLSLTDSRFKNKLSLLFRANTIQFLPTKPNFKITIEGYLHA